MLITKFNKLIHNKIIWAVFAVIISISMVGLFSPKGGSRSRSAATRSNLGTIYGKPVSRAEFNAASLFARKFQPMRAKTEEDRKMANEAVWQRLAILGLAQKMNVGVSNAELNRAIQTDRSFAVNGVFSPVRYRQLIEGQMHIKRSTYEAYLRQEMTLSKMTAIVAQSIWVAPSEVEESVTRLTDMITAQIIDIPYSNSVSDVKASEEDVRKYYDEHQKQFEIPEMRSVKYVEWPVSNFVAKTSISEEAIKDYYDDNIEDFATTDTNRTETYTPLKDVSDTIKTKLALREAIDLAAEDAMQFTDDIIDIGYDTNVNFEAVAAKHKFTVHTSKLFSAAGPVPEMNVSQRFVDDAFRLKKDTPQDSYSHAIVETNAIYVLAIDKVVPPRIPEFADVKDEVRKYADSLAKSTAFRDKAENVHEQILAAIKKGTKLEKIAKKLGLNVRSPKPFSVYESIGDASIADIAPAVMGMSKGEVSEPVPTSTGAAVIYLEDRQPGDLAAAESLKPEIARTIKSNRMQPHFITWAKSVLAEARDTKENAAKQADSKSDNS